jgi:multidrug efflux pump subunit AcrB
MADMSGRSFAEIVVTPRTELLQSIGLLPEAIENTIRAANLSLGNIILRDKQFQYHVRAGGQLVNAGDIAGLYLNHRGRVWQLGELCHIETRVRETEGLVLSQNQRAISLAIIKQGDARMQDLKTELHQMVSLFENDYPHLQFSITRDQTQLLDLTLANLGQTLVVGAFLAFLVMFLFLRDPRAPWIIMVAVPAALIISLLFFFMAGMSVNIISISGLILCIGMMIDNSIIVIDNITRYRKQGKPLYEACVTGTNEVFTPLLSSVLTTCSVFIPLVFLSGLAGALFFDQAMAVSIGLLVSLAIAITLIPTLYYAIYRKKPVSARGLLARLNPIDYERLYTRGFHFVMRRQWVVWGVFCCWQPCCLLCWRLWKRNACRKCSGRQPRCGSTGTKTYTWRKTLSALMSFCCRLAIWLSKAPCRQAASSFCSKACTIIPGSSAWFTCWQPPKKTWKPLKT